MDNSDIHIEKKSLDADYKDKKIISKEIDISGMTCNHCVSRVEEALNSLDGVNSKVDLENNKAYIKSSIDYDNKTLIDVIKDAGYEVVNIH